MGSLAQAPRVLASGLTLDGLSSTCKDGKGVSRFEAELEMKCVFHLSGRVPGVIGIELLQEGPGGQGGCGCGQRLVVVHDAVARVACGRGGSVAKTGHGGDVFLLLLLLLFRD